MSVCVPILYLITFPLRFVYEILTKLDVSTSRFTFPPKLSAFYETYNENLTSPLYYPFIYLADQIQILYTWDLETLFLIVTIKILFLAVLIRLYPWFIFSTLTEAYMHACILQTNLDATTCVVTPRLLCCSAWPMHISSSILFVFLSFIINQWHSSPGFTNSFILHHLWPRICVMGSLKIQHHYSWTSLPTDLAFMDLTQCRCQHVAGSKFKCL